MRRVLLTVVSAVGAVALLTGAKGCSSGVDDGPDYASITCADWKGLSSDEKTEGAELYADTFNDPKGDDDAPALVTGIDTTCASYDDETPAHIADVSIRSVYGN